MDSCETNRHRVGEVFTGLGYGVINMIGRDLNLDQARHQRHKWKCKYPIKLSETSSDKDTGREA